MRRILFALFILSCIALNAQTKTVKVALRNGATIIGELKELDALDHITLNVAESETTIKMSEVAYIDKVGSQQNEIPSKTKLENKKIVMKEQILVEDKLANYKGFLLKKGNNVYVCSFNSDKDDDSDYDKAGAEVIKQYLIKDGFWNVVDNMNDAHFTINYFVDTRWGDKAFLSISSWRTNKSLTLDIKRTRESVLLNVDQAIKMYYSCIVPFQEKIEMGTLSKAVYRDFIIK